MIALREACFNFVELCKKKNQDRLWMDEIAAMQASRVELPFLGSSGIVLASEENYPSQISGLSGGKQNGSIDASVSDSSLGSVDLNQGMVEILYSPCHFIYCVSDTSMVHSKGNATHVRFCLYRAALFSIVPCTNWGSFMYYQFHCIACPIFSN